MAMKQAALVGVVTVSVYSSVIWTYPWVLSGAASYGYIWILSAAAQLGQVWLQDSYKTAVV